SSR
ncbi:FHIPEP family protein, partial [Vibrio parahaemolyticus VPTS-2010_2]